MRGSPAARLCLLAGASLGLAAWWPAGPARAGQQAPANAGEAAAWSIQAVVAERSGTPGSFLTFPFTVQPGEPPAGPVQLCPGADPGWELVSQPRTLTPAQLQAARTRPLRLLISVRVPEDLPAGHTGEVRLVAVEGERCDVPGRTLAAGTARAAVARHRALELEAEAADPAVPGRRWSGRVRVRNRGNADEELQLSVRSNLGWPAWVEPSRFRLAAFGEQAVALALQVPEEAGAGTAVVLQVQASSPDGEVRREAAVRTTVDWGALRRRRRPEEERVLRGQLSVDAGWPAGLAAGAGAVSTPSASATLRLDARLPASRWELGIGGSWNGQSASLQWPWVTATDAVGQSWSLGTGTPSLPYPLGLRSVGGFSLAAASLPREEDRRLRVGLLGGAGQGLVVVEELALRNPQPRRWALAAGTLNGAGALGAEGRLPVREGPQGSTDLVAALAWSGSAAALLGMELARPVWRAGAWWEELPSGFAGTSTGARRVRVEGWWQPGTGRAAGAWVRHLVTEGATGQGQQLGFGLRLQPSSQWGLQWDSSQQLDSGGQFASSQSVQLFLRGGAPGASWYTTLSASQPSDGGGQWLPRWQLWLPVGRWGEVLWQPSVMVERAADLSWQWAGLVWARYERSPRRLAVLAEATVAGSEGVGLRESTVTVALERTLSSRLAARVGLSATMTPTSPPVPRLVAGVSYLFARELPEPTGTVSGRLVGWQERDPAFRWPPLAVRVDGEVAGHLQPDGTFQLQQVPAGRRRVEVDTRQFPAMWFPPGGLEVEVAQGRESRVELAVLGAGVAEGVCYADLNEDGQRQPGEPEFGGCAVEVALPDGPALALGSDPSGRWQLSGVRPGRYVVRAVGTGFPEPVRQVAGRLAPWLLVLASMGGTSRWVWQGGPVEVELEGWPQVARLQVGLRPPVSAPQAGAGAAVAALGLSVQVEPETVPPGGELRVQVRAEAELTRVEVQAGEQRVVQTGAAVRQPVWMAVPPGMPVGVLEVVVKAWGRQGQQEEQRVVVLVDPQVALLRAQAQPALVRAGQALQVEAQAVARLKEARVETPWGEFALAPAQPGAAGGPWRAALTVPAGTAPGLYTLTVRAVTLAGVAAQATARVRVRD
ncbi:MAG TPA: hypothetical protein VIL11_07690 [Limnochordales bacterium]